MQSENGSKKVLIVEDDKLQQIILERMVNKLGHTVMGKVSAGSSAIQSALRLNTVDLILMDIRLEDDIDGIEAMHKIKQSSSDIKVIYITANSEEKNLKRAQKTGYIDFIQKPVSLDRLRLAFGKAWEVA